MEFTAFQDGLDHLVGGDIPGVTARQRIPRMPGERDDAAAFRMREDRLPDQAEIDAVQVGLVPHLDTAEVEAHEGGIAARHGLHVGTGQGVGRPVFDLPGMAVGEVVLVAVQDFTLLHVGEQFVDELVLGSVHRLLVSCGTGNQRRGGHQEHR